MSNIDFIEEIDKISKLESLSKIVQFDDEDEDTSYDADEVTESVEDIYELETTELCEDEDELEFTEVPFEAPSDLESLDELAESIAVEPTPVVKAKRELFKRKQVTKNIDSSVPDLTVGSTDKINSNTSTVKGNSYSDIATEYSKKMLTDYIVKEIEARGIDIIAASNKVKSGNIDFIKLNMLIRECRNRNVCTTIEFCVELFTRYFDKISVVISMLHEENYFMLKSELRQMYKLDGYKLTSVMQEFVI